jgi:streptogramin lyase
MGPWGVTAVGQFVTLNAVWIADFYGSLYEINMSGGSTRFNLYHGSQSFYPAYGTVGVDGRFYLSNALPPPGNNFLGVITVSGSTATVVEVKTPSGDAPTMGIVQGPDANVWFTESGHVGRITTRGKVTEYPYQSGERTNVDAGIVVGPDNLLWFTQYETNRAVRLDPATGAMTEYPLTGCANPASIAGNVDGNIYVGCTSGSGAGIAQISTLSLKQHFFPLGSLPLSRGPQVLASGGSGQTWFAAGPQIGRLDATTGAAYLYTEPGQPPSPIDSVVIGPDGNVWAALTQGYEMVYLSNRITMSPPNLTFTAPGGKLSLSVTYSGAGHLRVHSSNPRVATVVWAHKLDTYTVSAVAAGSCTIDARDGLGNSSSVAVSVQ